MFQHANGGHDEVALPVLDRFKGSLQTFLTNVKQVCSHKNTPGWFQDFYKHLDSFSNDFTATIMDLEKNHSLLESELVIQKVITDGLEKERKRLDKNVNDLEAGLEDQRQYSRRTNILIHGLDEEAQEKTDDKMLEILQNKLQLPLSINDISRTHRLRHKVEGKKTPIIARFVLYR